MNTKALTALASVAVAAAVPGAAHAADLHAAQLGFAATPKPSATLFGLTSQAPCQKGGPTCGVVNVTLARNGRSIRQVIIGYEATCELPGMSMDGTAVVRGATLRRSGKGSTFKAVRQYQHPAGGGYTAVVNDELTGRLDSKRRTARGTYTGVAVISQNGVPVDSCATGPVTWKAQQLK